MHKFIYDNDTQEVCRGAGGSRSLPGPRASACVRVKCWVPERERSRGWGAGAAGCRHAGVSVCVGVCQSCYGSVWGHHRSGRGGLHRGVTPAPGYSATAKKGANWAWKPGMERVCGDASISAVHLLTVQGLTVRALLMKWNCSMPACKALELGGATISTSCSCSSCLLLSCLWGSTHRW